jgi:O-antigen biosynthesis protein WbqP
MIKRAFDLVASLCGLVVLALPMLVIVVMVRLDSPGPALFWSDRVGAGEQIFRMPKFRTMKVGTPQLATHLLADAGDRLTRLGRFLRASSLDELPQLYSVLRGDMSLVGPRPALFNQDDLIALRREAGVASLRPGVTGWAQVNGRDELPIPIKVEFDRQYAERQSLALDLKIIMLTVLRGSQGVAH